MKKKKNLLQAKWVWAVLVVLVIVVFRVNQASVNLNMPLARAFSSTANFAQFMANALGFRNDIEPADLNSTDHRSLGWLGLLRPNSQYDSGTAGHLPGVGLNAAGQSGADNTGTSQGANSGNHSGTSDNSGGNAGISSNNSAGNSGNNPDNNPGNNNSGSNPNNPSNNPSPTGNTPNGNNPNGNNPDNNNPSNNNPDNNNPGTNPDNNNPAGNNPDNNNPGNSPGTTPNNPTGGETPNNPGAPNMSDNTPPPDFNECIHGCYPGCIPGCDPECRPPGCLLAGANPANLPTINQIPSDPTVDQSIADQNQNNARLAALLAQREALVAPVQAYAEANKFQTANADNLPAPTLSPPSPDVIQKLRANQISLH